MRRYPVEAATLLAPGKNFTLSLWARGVGINGSTPTLRFGAPYYDFYPWATPTACPADKNCYTSSAVVTLTEEWVMHSVVVSTPPHPLNGDTSWVFVQLESAGKALVDLLELVEL
jgi:hypothetical protein